LSGILDFGGEARHALEMMLSLVGCRDTYIVKRVEKSPTGRCEAKVQAKRVPNAWNGGGRPCGNHPDPRRAGVSVGEAWLGRLQNRLQIAKGYERSRYSSLSTYG
jgi:hypothetical protein